MKNWKKPAAALSLVMAVLSGCSPLNAVRSPNSRFFVLTATASRQDPGSQTQRNISIGIGPVSLPGYLKRPELVTRPTANELFIASYARWAEPLRDNITRIIGENLSIMTGSDRIFFFPWEPAVQIDCQLIVEIVRFEGPPRGPMSLTAFWTVLDHKGRIVARRQKTTAVEPLTGQGHDAMAAAMSRALETLCGQVFEALPDS